MNCALIGYGKMGKLLETTAGARGHRISAIVDPYSPDSVSATGLPILRDLQTALKNDAGLNGADVAIEFTRPDTAAANVTALLQTKIPTVVGTTGWYDKLPALEKLAGETGAALLWASNFSIGVNLFYRIAAYAAKLADPLTEYDVGGYEVHHNKKADSPSGTAKTLVARVLAEMSRKKKPVWEMLDRPPAADELHYPSLRVGAAPGVHTLIFDSSADTIEITHTARNREGLVLGALRAAEWLVSGPGHQGVFTMDDVLADLFKA
ncbi:4-hydroxy-tetrahydrodipicolinate reductase [Spirochaetia bacterium]|nr:4-hydroxy-tetrahydrodipicolinate reductase [Spirochaetia bacterium]